MTLEEMKKRPSKLRRSGVGKKKSNDGLVNSACKKSKTPES